MSRVGQGAMGVASNLPTLEELLESSAADRRHVVELRPGILVTDWFLHSGTAYVAALQPMFDGRRLDIVDVISLLDTGLTRAETLADCIATAGTFFFDADVDTEDAFIWNSTNWDDGKFWDRFPRLFVHLENGSNPRDTQVLARVVFYMAGRGAVVPDLGPDKLGDGDFEGAWSGGAPPGWTKDEDGSGAVSEETADPLEGAKSVGLALGADAGVAAVLKTLDVEVGAQYRVTARYRTGAQNRLGSSLYDGASFVAAYEMEADGSGIGPTLTEVNPPAGILVDGIAAHFELGADGAEETGAITATFIEEGSPTYGAGLFGDAVTFPTASDRIRISHSDTNGAFDFGTGDFAMHFKVKRSATTGSSQNISQKITSDIGYLLKFAATDKLEFRIGDGASQPSVTGTTVVTDTDWHSISVFRVSGTVSVYLDGQLEVSGSLPDDVDNATSFLLGHNSAGFVGTIDQALFHGSGAGFYGDIAAAAAAYHAGTLGGAAVGVVIGELYGAAVQGNGAQLTLVTGKSDSPYFTLDVSSGSFDPGAESFVLALKFRLDSGDGRSQVLFDCRKTTLTQGWHLFRNGSGNTLRFHLEDNSGNITQANSTTAVTAGATYASVAVVVDRGGDLIKLYLNAVLEASVSMTGTPADISGLLTLLLGADFNATGFNVDGRIDQVRFIRGRTWDAADVLEYHAAAAGSPPGPWAPSTLQIRVGTGAAGWLSEDGRSYGTARYGAPLARTSARERVATFDFVAHTAAPSLRLELIGTGAATATLDAVELRRIWRWHFARPRLLAGAMPSSSQGQQDTFFGSDVIGQGEVGLANGDALMEQLLGAFDWLSADVRVHQGGVMPDNRELPFCHYLRRFTGRVEDIPTDAVTDRDVRLPLEDLKGLLHRDAPPNSYGLAAFPSMIASKAGEPRPLWIGPKTNVSPVRIIRDPDTGYGTYELADPSVSPAGLKAVDAVYAYLDETAARERVSASRLTLSSGTDYSVDLVTCRLTILRDVQVIEVTAEASLLDFDVGGSALLATLTPGLYTPATLAAEAETRLDAAASVSDISVTYDEELHRFTVAKAAGTLNLLAGSGANTELSGWGVLGFDRSAGGVLGDKSGLLSYQGDLTDPLFDRDEGADVRHILRVDGDGYKDDAAGTYTGTASALITIGADVARFVWHQLMRQPLARFDDDSAAAARISHPESLGVYLAGRTSTRTIFEALKASNLAQIVIGGDGTLYYVPYTSTVPATAAALRDRDFTRWQAGQPRADVHPEVVVLYDEDPTTSARRERRATEDSIRLVAGRLGRKELETYHTTDDGAQLTANRAQALSAARPWVADVTVPSRLARRRPQDFVLVTRSRALGGPFTAEPFRIVWMQHGRQTEARLVQNVEI